MRLALIIALASSCSFCSLAKETPSTATVKKGQTLYSIATSYGISVERLKALNNLADNTIEIGQTLKLTGKTNAYTSNFRASRPVTNSDKLVHSVQTGDTLGKIAEKYGVSVGELQAYNSLSGTAVDIGQKLAIPPRGAPISKVPPVLKGMEPRTIYTYERVGHADTPSSFASRYNSTPNEIRSLNMLSTLNQILPGALLMVPRKMAVPIPPRPVRQAVTFQSLNISGALVKVVKIDLRYRNVLVTPVLPAYGYRFGSGATVGVLTRQSGARALINGSYFHPRTYAPAGDIVMRGKLLTWGRLPAALAITPDNRAKITGGTTGFGRPLDSTWSGMETVVASGPRVLINGIVQTFYGKVFRDPAVFKPAARSAICLKSSRDLLLVSTHSQLTVRQAGNMLARLGCRDALLLDGGSSSGISFNGSVVLNSVRKVSYGIGVFSGYSGKRYSR